MENFDTFIAPCPKCGNLLKVKHKLSALPPSGHNSPILDDVQLSCCMGLRNYLVLINKELN